MKTDILVFLAVILLDQFSKFFAPKLGLTVVKNTGVAFGLFPNFCWGAMIIFILGAFLVSFFKRTESPSSIIHHPSSLLVLAGGFSNFLDRLFFGYIRDFVDLKIWPVFNLADAAITIGVVMLLLKNRLKLLPAGRQG